MNKLSSALPIKNYMLRHLSCCVLHMDNTFLSERVNSLWMRDYGTYGDVTKEQAGEAVALMTWEEKRTPLMERMATLSM